MRTLGRISLIALLSSFGAAIAEGQAFTLDTTSLQFNTSTIVTSPPPLTVILTNNTAGSLGFSVSSSTITGGPWLSASASPNPVPGNGNSTITVSVNSSKLPPGNYSGMLSVSGGGTTATVSVSLGVNGIFIQVSPDILTLSLPAGQNKQQGIQVTGGPASLLISGSTQDAGNWITLNNSKGTKPPGTVSINDETAPGSFSIIVNTTGLAAGTHTGTVAVQCINGAQCPPVFVSVSVNVSDLMLSPTSLAFTANAGASPLAQTATVTNSTPNSIAISIASTTQSGGNWLLASAPSNVVGGSGSAITITVRIDSSMLAPSPNAYQGTVTITGGGFSKQIAVSLTVNGVTISVAPTALSFTAAAGDKAPLQKIQVTQVGAAVVVTPNTSAGGSWLSASAASTPGSYNIVADALKLNSGSSYAGDLAVSCDGSKGPSCVTVHVPVNFTVTAPAAGQPSIAPGGVITAGAFGAASSIGPGTYIEIYGSNLASSMREWAGSDFIGLNAPLMLDNVSLKINGHSAFIRFISPNQVNALAPDNLGTGSAQMILTTSAGSSTPYSVNVTPLQPGLLAPPVLKINNLQYVVAICSDGKYVLPAGNPVPGLMSRQAKPDETVVIFGIGFGAVSPDVPTGAIAQGLTKLKAPLQVSFGQTPAMVNYQGLAPGFVGLYQFNVVVPGVPDSDAVLVTFTLNGVNLPQQLFTAVHR